MTLEQFYPAYNEYIKTENIPIGATGISRTQEYINTSLKEMYLNNELNFGEGKNFNWQSYHYNDCYMVAEIMNDEQMEELAVIQDLNNQLYIGMEEIFNGSICGYHEYNARVSGLRSEFMKNCCKIRDILYNNKEKFKCIGDQICARIAVQDGMMIIWNNYFKEKYGEFTEYF